MPRRPHSWRNAAVAGLAGGSGPSRSGESPDDTMPPRTGAAPMPRKPPTIVREPGVTAHAQIEDWLADAIAGGQLSPGDRLPAESDLAAWLGVSRMTLRHALGELTQRGLVTRAVGRG